MSINLLKSKDISGKLLLADISSVLSKILDSDGELKASIYEVKPEDLIVFARVYNFSQDYVIFRITPLSKAKQIAAEPIPDKYVYKLSEVMTTFLLNGIDYEKLV